MKEVVLTASVLILALILFRFLFRTAIPRRVQYALWALVLVRLLVPVQLPALPVVSVLDMSQQAGQQLTAVLEVDTGEESFSLPVEPQGFSFEGNVVTLDLRNQRLLYDQPWWRTPLLIGLRMVMTLALEGAVFWLFGYRQRRSWAVFLLVNLFTQGAVNLALHLLIPTGTDYFVVLGLFFYTPMELLVLVVEIAAFCLLLRERTKGRAAGCAAVANLLSWGLGGLLLACLPI